MNARLSIYRENFLFLNYLQPKSYFGLVIIHEVGKVLLFPFIDE